MAGDWRRTQLGVVCEVNPEKRDPSWPHRIIEYIDITSVGSGLGNAPPSLVISDEAPSRAQRLVRAGDTIVSTVRPNRRSFLYLRKPASNTVVSTGFAVLRPKEGLEPRFLYYLIADQAFTDYLASRADGSAYPAVNASVFNDAEISLPPLSEQHAIAHILGTLDDKIELNRRANETQEAMARAIFKSWFVDFDPVVAKAAGLDPGLPKALADLFPDSLAESELGKVPNGWEVKNVYAIADVRYGAPFNSALFNGDRVGKPLIRIRDLATHNPETFTLEEHPRGYLVRPGELIVGMDGEFRAHLWRGPEAWLNQRLCCFKPKSGIPRAFVHYSIESTLDFFERSKTGTTVIHLGKSDIDTFRVLTPPETVLQAFTSVVAPLDSRIVGLAQESRALASMRDTLLPKLISGDLRIQNAEGFPGARA